jgi:predicted metal-dependent hydrolase
MQRLSIRNLIKRAADIQQMIVLEKVKEASASQTDYLKLLSAVSRNINTTTESVERIFSERGKSAADLPIRSRRAYQWIKYLSEGQHIQRHLDAVQRISFFLPNMPRSRRFNQYRVEFYLYHIGPLYKIRERKRTIEIVAQESFLYAPDHVLLALLDTALQPSSGSSRQMIRDYASGKQYKTIRESLEYLSIPPGKFSTGKQHDLEKSFHRVNRYLFNNRLKKPHLVWNNRMTRRKFGHYQEDTNTVMVSISLDHPRVPEYVLDYVMYHELLHQKLGARLKNDRRYTHTPEFKKKELDFPRIEKAQQFLNKLSRS